MRRILSALANGPKKVGVTLKSRLNRDRRSTRMLVDALLLPADVLTIQSGHKRRHGSAPNLLRPRTVNEFLQHEKLFNRTPLRTMLADKLAVRDHVSDRIGAEYLSRIYWTGTDLRDADLDALPLKFVLKANHACRTHQIVRDKSAEDWTALAATADRWLGHDHSLKNGEWQYRWIPPTLYIEEFLEQPGEISPVDYKFYCFHGIPRMAVAIHDRTEGKRRDFVDLDGKTFDCVWGENTPSGRFVKPECWSQMIELAGLLADGLAFVRVDFYALPRIVFGEMTLCPGGGTGRFHPPEKDREVFERYLAGTK